MMLQAILCGLSVSLLPPVPPDDTAQEAQAGPRPRTEMVRIQTTINAGGADAAPVPVVIEVEAEHAAKVLSHVRAGLAGHAPQPTLIAEPRQALLMKLEKLEEHLDNLNQKLVVPILPPGDQWTLASSRGRWRSAGIPNTNDLVSGDVWLDRVLFGADLEFDMAYYLQVLEAHQRQMQRSGARLGDLNSE
jgi:hypothetical protein